MANLNIKRTEILGTKGLFNSNKVIIYNTKTFYNEQSLNSMGISKGEAEILREQPTLDTVEIIADQLKEHEEYEPIKAIKDIFVFENNKFDSIRGQGFDTLIFLEGEEEVIGYITLVEPVFTNLITERQELVKLRRNYIVGKVNIYLDRVENVIRIDKDTVSLLNTIDVKSDKRDWTKLYLSDSTDLKIFQPYSSRLNSIVNSRSTNNTFTEGLITHKTKDGNIERFALKLLNGIELGEHYTFFKNAQVGYFLREPALYVWDDQGHYSIFSLVRKLSEVLPGASDSKPLPLTVPKKGVSDSEIYNIRGNEIDYFSGHYIISKNREIFNIVKNEWVVTEKGERLKNFMVDLFSLDGGFIKLDSVSWPNFKDAVDDFPEFSNTHADTASLLLEGDEPYCKIGDWLVFKGKELITYTNYTRTIRFRLDEEKPIVVNNQVLVGKSKGRLIPYRNEGYFISESAKLILGDNYSDGVSYRKIYKTEKESILVDNWKTYVDIQKSPLGMYRRNYGPDAIGKDFNIIGSLGGIIYYRQGNSINYL